MTDTTKQESKVSGLSPSTELSHQPRAEEEVEDDAIPEADSRGRAMPWRLEPLRAAAWGGRESCLAPTQVSTDAVAVVAVAVAAVGGAVKQRPPWTVGEP